MHLALSMALKHIKAKSFSFISSMSNNKSSLWQKIDRLGCGMLQDLRRLRSSKMLEIKYTPRSSVLLHLTTSVDNSLLDANKYQFGRPEQTRRSKSMLCKFKLWAKMFFARGRCLTHRIRATKFRNKMLTPRRTKMLMPKQAKCWWHQQARWLKSYSIRLICPISW